MSEHVLVANHCYASTQRWTALLCDSVSHVSVWSAAMPLFPFPGRLGIIQGKAGRQTQGGEAAKNLTYYREVRLLLFAVTFRLSGLGALLLLFFFFFLLVTACCIENLFSPVSLFFYHKIWHFIFFYPYERFSLSLFVSLSWTSCAVPRSPEAASLTSQRNASQEVVLSAVCVCACVWTLKGIGDF